MPRFKHVVRALAACGLAVGAAHAVTITEFPLGPGAQPQAIASAAGSVWVTQSAVDRLARVDPVTGNKTDISGLVTGAAPSGIVEANGLLWFAEAGADRIARYDPAAGQLKEYTAGISAGSRPLNVAVDTAGIVWFTESNGARIGRLDPVSEAVQEFATPTPASQPNGIALGADGKLWFTETAAHRIGRLDPATNQITEFPLSGAAGPLGIVSGPDSNLWFTQSTANSIARFNPVGVVNTLAITEFSAGLTANVQPNQIARGPDGHLWFSTLSGARIGRITTSGVITEFTQGVTGSSKLRGIAAGPNDTLWYVSDEASRVGRVSNLAATTTLQFDRDEYRVNETCFGAIVKVTRVGDLSGGATVEYATSDGNASAPEDYEATSGKLIFGAGVSEQSFTVRIFDRGGVESNETVVLSLVNAVGAELGAQSSSRITIFDSLRFEGRGDECDDGRGRHGGCAVSGAVAPDPTLPALALMCAAALWRRKRRAAAPQNSTR